MRCAWKVGLVNGPVTLLLLLAFTRADASGGGNITGKVEAAPAKYLEETVVYLKNVPGKYPPKTTTLDQKGMKFIPHVLALVAGDKVNFLNHDAGIDHNVYSPDQGGYNLGIFKTNESRSHTFDKEGRYTQLCSIHPEMLAYIFVGQNPYSTVVDKSGHYTIKDVPPGSYQLEVWNPKLKAAAQSITVSAGGTADANFSLKR